MKNSVDAKQLLQKYREGTCSPEELAILESWYLAQAELSSPIDMDEIKAAREMVWKKLPIHHEIRETTVKHIFNIPVAYLKIAALILLTFSVGLLLVKKPFQSKPSATLAQHEIKPGQKKALLTLADGKSIALNDTKSGVLANQFGSSISVTKANELIYEPAGSSSNKLAFNILSIPRGGYYSLTLSDGTKVWLNAESSLKYPVTFVGNERLVELEGEAYFEVAKRSGQPFRVKTNQQTVEVLGTHFNVSAYKDDEQTLTTLLEGRVKLTNNQFQALNLTPGNQAKLKNGAFSVKPVNTELAIDWISNDFILEDEELGSIMKKISRWYDVEVEVPSNLSRLTFSGNVSRSKNINQVLKIVELTELVNIKIEERRITVTP